MQLGVLKFSIPHFNQMQELTSIIREFSGNWKALPVYNKKITALLGTMFSLTLLSLLYCIVGMYHQYYKGLICFMASLAVTSMTFVSLTMKANPIGILLVDCAALFTFVHVMTRKWAYLSNDHDMINDFIY